MTSDDSSSIRITHAERERTVELLSDALAEGQLQPSEFDERCGLAWSAITRGELVPLTADLGRTAEDRAEEDASMQDRAPARTRSAEASATPRRAREVIVGVLGEDERRGSWPIPVHTVTVAVMGGTEIDMRDCTFPPGETIITAVAVMGGVEIKLPDDVRVVKSGMGLLGEFSSKHQANYSLPEDAPVVRLRGVGLLGSVEVR